MTKVRWGILSTANIGMTKVTPAIQQAENCEVVAIASRSEEQAQGAAKQLSSPGFYASYEALLEAIEGEPPYAILDLGCGPGRDLRYFRSLGHDATGLDGSKEFVAMARSYSGCEVLRQDFLEIELPESHFDGVFANASLFHVPSQELSKVLLEIFTSLKSRGVLFCSNPRGEN